MSRTLSLTDNSGTLSSANVPFTVFAQNRYRKYLFIQNLSGGNLWLDFGTDAVTSKPSIKLTPGDSFEMDTVVTTDSVSLIGESANTTYVAKQIIEN